MHLLALGLAAVSATVTVDPRAAGPRVPEDFVGICVSRASIDGDHHYRRDFVPGNTGMVRLFREVGVRHLRVISGTADAKEPDPKDPGDDDAFFAFVRAVGITGPEVIYSLHLFNGHAGVPRPEGCDNRVSASYVWGHFRDLVQAFALDNEVDWKHHFRAPYPDPVIRGYASPAGHGYKDEWARERAAILDALHDPNVPFAGPDTGSKWPVHGDMTDDRNNTSIGGVPFTLQFVRDEAGKVALATQHLYCDNDKQASGVAQLVDWSLSQRQVDDWETLNAAALKGNAAWPAGLPYRLTEASPYSGGRLAAAQNFASALEGLEMFHWFAAHGCDGIDPFNRTAQTNAPLFWTGKEYWAAPYAYGMKAFGLAAPGRREAKVELALPQELKGRMTAYAQSDAKEVYVTIINKTYPHAGGGAEEAQVEIRLPAGAAVTAAEAMDLRGATRGDPTARQAILGEAELSPDRAEFEGRWSAAASNPHGCTVTVPATTAIIVRMALAGLND